MQRTRIAVMLTAALILASCVDEDVDTAGQVAVIDQDTADDVEVEVDEEYDDEDWDDEEYDDEDWDDEEYEDEQYEDDEDLGGALHELGEATFFETDCPFEVESQFVIDCGVVEVPESRQGLSDATVEIAIAIIRTPSDNPDPDPVVYLHGGPGGTALEEYAGFIPDYSFWEEDAFFSSRDLILVDQRGGGLSKPSIECAEEEDVEDCYDRLVDDGITLAAFSTPENAADIAAMRIALGYEEWNFYGSSYGTRLGLVVMRDHPEGVRSAILAGVYPPDKVPAYHDNMANALRSIEVMIDECGRQPACDDAYGDVYELLIDALYAAENSPSGPSASDFYDAMFQAMYYMTKVAEIPRALSLASSGALDDAMAILEADSGGFDARPAQRASTSLGAFPDGTFFNFECREEQAFTEFEVLEGQAEEYRQAGWDDLLVDVILSGAQAQTEAACTVWDSGRAAPAERAPAVSDIPTLVLSGEFDPITPPSWGDLAAESLSRSTHVVAPSLSHVLVGVDNCIESIVFRFLGDPGSQLDTGCVPAMETIAFVLP